MYPFGHMVLAFISSQYWFHTSGAGSDWTTGGGGGEGSWATTTVFTLLLRLSPHHHPTKENSALTASSHRLKEFYQTFGSSQHAELGRPLSKKQPSRKRLQHRPETSKGLRKANPWNNPFTPHNAHSQSQYLKEPQQACDAVEEQGPSVHDIEIIVTRSSAMQRSKNKLCRSKFDTDLDDEFLELFAN